MSTDLDRLHAVVSGELRGRQVGKTWAHCHDLVSAIELGEPEVRAVVATLRDVNHVLPMLVGVLQERGHHVKQTGQFQLVVDFRHEVRFVSLAQAPERTPGSTAIVRFHRYGYEAELPEFPEPGPLEAPSFPRVRPAPPALLDRGLLPWVRWEDLEGAE